MQARQVEAIQQRHVPRNGGEGRAADLHLPERTRRMTSGPCTLISG
jgi:hypothetical protein